MRVRTIHGVDFSGAAKAGQFIWIARCEPTGDAVAMPRRDAPNAASTRALPRLRLASLDRLEDLVGTPARDACLAWLLDAIRASRDALWGIDFPFGLPVELGWRTWPAQLDALRAWADGANAFGRRCCDLSLAETGRMHVRRDTDRETRTPFDCYHYRIIHQTFHGMRELMVPLRADAATCVLPFEIDALAAADRVVAEACPGSTLRRLALPYNRYKQAAPGRIAASRVKTRHAILDGIAPLVEVDAAAQKVILRNPGGDALDAVLAAVGVWFAWRGFDADAIARHPRYRHEGLVFA